MVKEMIRRRSFPFCSHPKLHRGVSDEGNKLPSGSFFQIVDNKKLMHREILQGMPRLCLSFIKMSASINGTNGYYGNELAGNSNHEPWQLCTWFFYGFEFPSNIYFVCVINNIS